MRAATTISLLLSLHSAFGDQNVFNDGACIADDDNKVAQWRDDDKVELFIGDQPMQYHVMLESIGLETSHMAVCLFNKRMNKWLTLDFSARDFGSVASIVLPTLHHSWNDMPFWEQTWRYLKGDLFKHMEWRDDAAVRIHDDRPVYYKNLASVGITTGASVKAFRKWVIEEYTRQDVKRFTFDVYAVYNGTTHERIRTSRSCHDFVEEAITRLDFPDAKNKTISTYRDSFNYNASSFGEVDFSRPKIRRDFQRFMRLLRNRIFDATRELPSMLQMFTMYSYYNMPWMIYVDGDKYMRISFTDEMMGNYCRMPLEVTLGQPIIPAKYNDSRIVCKFPHYTVTSKWNETYLTFPERLIWIEQRLDDFLFGWDGDGGAFEYLAGLSVTTVSAILISKIVYRFAKK